MKLLKKDLKQGFIQVRTESMDDLWLLYTVLQRGDLVSGETERKIKIGGENDRNMKVVRKKMFLKLKVESPEFSKHTQNLRISGSIIEGPEDISFGSFHTLNVEIGSIIGIEKQWKNYEIEKLNKAEQNAGKITIITLFDRENAIFSKLDITGVEHIAELKGSVAKKVEGVNAQGNFWKEIVEKTKELNERYKPQHIIFASPGFWREYVQKELSPELVKKVIFSACSDVNSSAISEVIKRPELAKALKEEAAASEELLIEELLKALHDDKASIGLEECYESINSGKCSKFLVSENLIMELRQKDKFSKLEELMKAAENSGSEVHLIGSNDSCKQLDGIGGIACINRWGN